jgi:hypothetical protein
MKIDEFCGQFGGNTRNINDVLRRWQLNELDGLLRTLRDQHDQLIGTAVIAGDALHGDGMLDQIPHELRDAFVNLMHEKADTYEQMRQILLHHIRADNSGFLSLDDGHVVGFISKIKGQIGENIFQHHVGTAAHLAPSGCQEAWDIWLDNGEDGHEYVQVKLHASASKIVSYMRIVQEKVANSSIEGWHSETVHNIDFAVPEDIADHVRHLAANYPELHDMHVLPIPVSPAVAADFVKEGMSNVGPEQLGHFFHELLGGAVAAGSLHALVNGFLWYKGSKEFFAAFAGAAASTAISTTGIGLGLVTETLYHAAMLSGAVGISSRLLLGRLARSRWNLAEFLEKSIAEADARIAALQQACMPQPATG